MVYDCSAVWMPKKMPPGTLYVYVHRDISSSYLVFLVPYRRSHGVSWDMAAVPPLLVAYTLTYVCRCTIHISSTGLFHICLGKQFLLLLSYITIVLSASGRILTTESAQHTFIECSLTRTHSGQ